QALGKLLGRVPAHWQADVEDDLESRLHRGGRRATQLGVQEFFDRCGVRYWAVKLHLQRSTVLRFVSTSQPHGLLRAGNGAHRTHKAKRIASLKQAHRQGSNGFDLPSPRLLPELGQRLFQQSLRRERTRRRWGRWRWSRSGAGWSW